MLKRALSILVGFAVGAAAGWVLGVAIGERVLRDCVEMDCLAMLFYAYGGALVGATIGSVAVWLASRRWRTDGRGVDTDPGGRGRF